LKRESVVVVAPGRGTYNASELGYLAEHHAGDNPVVRAVDEHRHRLDQIAVSELDGADQFRPALHGLGSNASALIYAAALSDFAAIDRDRYDVVAVTGNSMGWYLALAAAGVTEMLGSGITLVEQMATLMDNLGVGGQLLYPLVDEHWQPVAQRQAAVSDALAQAGGELFVSIRLGGSIVLAGTSQALRAAESQLPKVDDQLPARLVRHSAFHTPLLKQVSERALELLPSSLFASPVLPLIDGCGEIWQPGSDPEALREYTLCRQVLETYDFSRAVTVAVREFAPDRVIVLGPGRAMGAPVLQTLLHCNWLGIGDRQSWQTRQASDPFVLAMGVKTQRALVTG